jgi:hypothetical protein
VSEFVDECRREWRRLGVPDPIANEMAADLTADLEEAGPKEVRPKTFSGTVHSTLGDSRRRGRRPGE